MNENILKELLQDIYNRKTTPQAVLRQLKNLPYENLDFARSDHHRAIRGGIPEVVFCEGKSPEQIISIINKMHSAQSDILATRLCGDTYKAIKRKIPQKAIYNQIARTLVIHKRNNAKQSGLILVATAGTSDIPVAEEAVTTADFLGSKVEKVYDVGVAGIHRLFDKIELFHKARVVIVVAGMDGALASVVAGLIRKPVVAVPTSVGYGASFKGIAALLSMLNSCSAGIGTVNIDNGFGAACLAHKINLLGEPEEIQ
jgi:NCAIR mutase (PurE)-related protein